MKGNTITKVRVDNLYGLYSYNLPKESIFSDATILYGDNGVGKSTLLRLMYHLLSHGNNRGHRNALNDAEFSFLEVKLSTGITVSAKPMIEDNLKFLRLDICDEKNTIARWNYISKRSTEGPFDDDFWDVFNSKQGNSTHIFKKKRKIKNKDGIPTGEKIYLEKLAEYAPVMFMLNADRRLDSDTVADPSDEVELRQLMHFDTPKSINQLVQRSREIGLTQALSSASKWISQKAIIGTNKGSTNVHSVYTDVVNSIISPYSNLKDNEIEQSTLSLIESLNIIEKRMQEHAHYQLATELSIEDFVNALQLDTKEKSDLAAELLKPYIQSLERRLEAVEPVYKILDDFVKAINVFLNDKEIVFKLGKGFSILNKLSSPLESSQLSSGEQQLLLLFCYVITARDNPSVFIIDEPEISLNVKWQRQLIQALLDVTKGSEIQFIFASHSMELLAQHRNRVVKLENSK